MSRSKAYGRSLTGTAASSQSANFRPHERSRDVEEQLALADAMTIDLSLDEEIAALLPCMGDTTDERALCCPCPPSPRAWPMEDGLSPYRLTRAHRKNWRKWVKDRHDESKQATSLPCFPPDWPERGIVP